MVSLRGTDTSPSSGVSSPTIMRNSVVLPEPFGPTSPTFSPGLNWNEASTNRTCHPYCLLMRLNEITARRDSSSHDAGCTPTRGGIGIDHRRRPAQHDAVIAFGVLDREIAAGDVAPHERRLAIERVTVP